ncbi:SIMPL domain-containing protein [Dehalococcoidia bacterium]|nr:SIMPL domain-containing protein [Dehalococcoidia bacterium]
MLNINYAKLYIALVSIAILAIGCDADDNTSESNKTVSAVNAQSQSSNSVQSAGKSLAPNSENSNTTSTAGIHVTGIGSKDAKPDLSVVNIGVETRGETVATARSKAVSSMSKVLTSLDKNDVDTKDVQTSNFSIYPEYVYEDVPGKRYSVQKLIGYRVANAVKVKVRNLDRLGDIIDDAASSGGDDIRINGISFTIEDTKVLEDLARKLAVADAINKAEEIARLTGTSLGRIVDIVDNPSNNPSSNFSRMEMGMLADYASTPISSGELTMTVSVNAVFSIVYD